MASDEIYTDESCYVSGEDITVLFTNGDARSDDWVGIYYSSADPYSLDHPLLWLWTCGDQDCRGKVYSGHLVFGSGPPVEKGTISFPLPAGEYIAVLVPNGHIPYSATAVSHPFTVKRQGQLCPGDDDVYTDMSVYEFNEDITVSFQNSMPEKDDWVGIYEYDVDTEYLGEPLLWLWTCGSQSCSTAVMSGSVVFGEAHPDEAGTTRWPLQKGNYIAVLSRNTGVPYPAIAVSDPFEVKRAQY